MATERRTALAPHYDIAQGETFHAAFPASRKCFAGKTAIGTPKTALIGKES